MTRADALPDDLAALLRTTWSELSAAARDRRGAFRNAVLATVEDGARARARIVVLRRADEAARLVDFHTDMRSAKIGQLRATAAVELLFWDPEAGTQLRLTGAARLHAPGDEAATAAFEAMPEAGREKYRRQPAPGSALRSPEENGFEGVAEGQAGDPGLRHFALIRVAVASIDHLRIAEGGQRRAMFHWDDAGGATATWVAP